MRFSVSVRDAQLAARPGPLGVLRESDRAPYAGRARLIHRRDAHSLGTGRNIVTADLRAVPEAQPRVCHCAAIWTSFSCRRPTSRISVERHPGQGPDPRGEGAQALRGCAERCATRTVSTSRSARRRGHGRHRRVPREGSPAVSALRPAVQDGGTGARDAGAARRLATWLLCCLALDVAAHHRLQPDRRAPPSIETHSIGWLLAPARQSPWVVSVPDPLAAHGGGLVRGCACWGSAGAVAGVVPQSAGPGTCISSGTRWAAALERHVEV